jgi:signal transduction histidine kinase
LNKPHFSLFSLLLLPEHDNNVEIRHKLRQIGIFYLACLIFVPFFIAKHWLDYDTTRYYPILIPSFVALACAPVIYRKTANYHFYSTYVVTLGIGLVILLIAFAGGNRAPAAFWLVGTPLIFGLIYGSRGVWLGSLVMAVTFVVFLLLNHWQLLPNLVAEYGDYEREKLINLIGFGVYNIVTSYYFISTEEKTQKELRAQRQETENLLRTLVHDVANPINAIQLVRYAAKTGSQSPEMVLQKIDETLAELSSMVQQVRKLRAIQDGKQSMLLAKVSIQSAMESTVKLLQYQAEYKGIRLLLERDEENAYVLADEALLKNTLLANLIHNSIKFSYPGQSVTIRLSVASTRIVISIEDQGMGMPESVKTQIFDPTAPTSRRGTGGEYGTGYGMPLVKACVDKLGGDIELVSSQAPGASGTKVTISLPRCED